jgi:hypothetical protein
LLNSCLLALLDNQNNTLIYSRRDQDADSNARPRINRGNCNQELPLTRTLFLDSLIICVSSQTLIICKIFNRAKKKVNVMLSSFKHAFACRSMILFVLFVHSEHVNLATVQPILQLIMCWLGVVLACQMKMQKNIVNLVEQGFV